MGDKGKSEVETTNADASTQMLVCFGFTCPLRANQYHLYPMMKLFCADGKGLFQDDSALSLCHEES